MIVQKRISYKTSDFMNQKQIAHEDSYKKINVASLIHKNRLQHIRRVFRKYIRSSEITWADFGCSNGFIPEEIVRTKEFRFARIVGFDNVERLLDLARAKKIPQTEFKYLDMNAENNAEERFDVVTCFETLEHVGNLHVAFINLFNYLGKNGIMIITVPNETGFIGLIKFLGRLAVRRNPYRDFFAHLSYFEYLKYLLRNDFIDGFRKPEQIGYGPHLGFDYRKLEGYIEQSFVGRKQLELIDKSFTGLKMNVFYVFKKG
jgi:2-polyprenyl-3-methyl-5-hydroxy-6-metoxy-1,4-benzoquinol methylase